MLHFLPITLQLAMGMVVNFFFGGFVMGKIPFALSPRFKPMLQVSNSAGVEVAIMDCFKLGIWATRAVRLPNNSSDADSYAVKAWQ